MVDALAETVIVIVENNNNRCLIEHPDGFLGATSKTHTLHPERKYAWVFISTLKRINKPDRKVEHEIKGYLEQQEVKKNMELEVLTDNFNNKVIEMPDVDTIKNQTGAISLNMYPAKIRHHDLDKDFFVTDDFKELSIIVNRILKNYIISLEADEKQIEMLLKQIDANENKPWYTLQPNERDELQELVKSAVKYKILSIQDGNYYFFSTFLMSVDADIEQYLAEHSMLLLNISKEVMSKQNVVQGLQNVEKLSKRALDLGILYVNKAKELCFFDHIFDNIIVEKDNNTEIVGFLHNNTDFHQQLQDVVDYCEQLVAVKNIGNATALKIIRVYNTIELLKKAVANNDLTLDEVINKLLAKNFK